MKVVSSAAVNWVFKRKCMKKDPKIEEKQTRRCYALPGEMKCPIHVTLLFSDQHFPLHFWAIVGGRQIVECLGRCLMYTLSLAPFSPRNPAICQIWRKSLGFFLIFVLMISIEILRTVILFWDGMTQFLFWSYLQRHLLGGLFLSTISTGES